MLFKNKRFKKAENYESTQDRVEKQNRDIVKFASHIDTALNKDRSNDPLVWDPTVAAMTYSSDGSVVLCRRIFEDAPNRVKKEYVETNVVDDEDLLNES